MTLKEYCEKFNIDYDKLLNTLKEYMREEDNNVLRLEMDYEAEDIQYQASGDVFFEIYPDTGTVQIRRHITWYMGKSCEPEDETDKWELDTEGELVDFFNEFYNVVKYNWADKAFAPYHGTRNELLDWLTKLKLIAKGNN